MKRFLAFLALVTVAHGTGTVQQSLQQLGQTNNWVLAYQWVGDSGNGTVPNTLAQGLVCCVGYLVVQVETVPGSPAPTAGYGVAIQDSSGVDVLNGAAAALSASAPQSFATSTSAPPVQGALTLVITGQNVAGAKGTVYVFLSKPGSVNVATLGRGAIASSANWLTLANSPIYDQRTYNFTAQQPGGSLSIGSNTITLTPCPLGVNGATDQGHSLRIQGGVGTAEAALITGGTCTSGAATGTVVITAANTHSGAWAVSSDSKGIQEAIIQAEANGGGIVQQTLSATTCATITVQTANFIPLVIQGTGKSVGNYIVRCPTFTTGDIISYNQTVGEVALTIRDMTFGNGGPFGSFINVTSGAAIHILRSPDATVTISNILINDGWTGIDLDGVLGAHVTGVEMVVDASYSSLFSSLTAIRLHNTVGGVVSANILTDINVEGNPTGNVPTNPLQSCIQIEYSDGLIMNTISCGGILHGIWVISSTGSFTNNIQANNLFIDTSLSHAVYFSGSGSPTLNGPFAISGSWINTEYGVNTAFNGAGIFVDTGAQLSKLMVTGTQITGCGQGGIVLNGTTALVSELTVASNIIADNNLSNAASVGGITFFGSTPTWTGVHIMGNHIYNSLAASHMTAGVDFAVASTTVTNSEIVGNDFCPVGSGTAFGAGNEILSTSTTYTKTTIGDNACVNSNTATTVASAATLAFPIYPNFLISGNTGVTAITTTALAPGEVGTLITTGGAVAFTAGATIGNSCTTTQNKPYVWLFDGTKVWLNGSGC